MAAITQIRRLRQMSFAELRFRLAQKVRISCERMTLAVSGSCPNSPSWGQFGNVTTVADPALRKVLSRNDAVAEELLPEYLITRKEPLFYFSHGDLGDIVRWYREGFQNRTQQIVEQAQRLCAYRLKVFAYPEAKFGGHIPWRTDFIHGIESGLQHWSCIPYLNFSKVGDSKIVWEPNRHQHLITLALAYRLTDDERYAEECFTQWENWERENPYLRGINWASSLELAFRAWSWMWMIHLLAGSVAMSGERVGALMRALHLHADFIATNVSTYYSPNTHLLGEGFALFVIGLLFPELRNAEFHKKMGRKILIEEITRQVRGDGSHAEQSTCYHRYATDFFLCAAIIADRNKCAFPLSYLAIVERMVDFMMHTAWPDGSQPMIGDADGGRLLAFAARDPNDHRSTLSTAAVYFQREDFRDRAGSFSEETLWLLGPSAAAQFQELVPKPPIERSRAFLDSGLVVMRNDRQSDQNMLLFDAGPQGMDGCGHGHADALSIVCSAQGTNWLVDPGTFVYTASREWRDYFRSTHAHNTVVVDERGQSEPIEAFKWRDICPARLERWATSPNLDYASGVHDGYKRLSEPVAHRRRVVFVKPDRWFLLDELSGRGPHSLEFLFHFCPDVRLHIEGPGCWAEKGSSRFFLATDPRLTLDTIFGGESRLRGWYSRDYGHHEPAAVLVGKIHCSVPARFPWILWPGAPDEARLEQVPGQNATWTLETDTQIDRFIFSDTEQQKADPEATTDSVFAFLRQSLNGKVERMSLLDGSWLNLPGTLRFRSSGHVDEFEFVRWGNSLDVRMRPVLPFTLGLAGVAALRLNGNNAEFKRSEDEIVVQEGN